MNFLDAVITRKNIKRSTWNDELIDVFLKFVDDAKYKMVIVHLNGSVEEHDYKLDVSDLYAEDWIILDN